MDATGWVLIISAVFLGATQLATQIVSMVLSYMRDRDKMVKLSDIDSHISNNTDLTVAGNKEATDNAKIAASAAGEAKKEAKETAKNLDEKFNGQLDSRITRIVKDHVDPINVSMQELHSLMIDLQDKKK